MDISEKFNNLVIEKRAYIDGRYVWPKSGSVIEKKGSYDGRDLSGIAACAQEDVDIAVKAAQKAYERGIWQNKSIHERCRILLKLAELIEDHKEEIALLDTLETSRAYQNYYYDSIPKAIEAIRYYAESADKKYEYCVAPSEGAVGTITRIPLGVVGIITPWNDPMVVSAWKYTPALLMGNSVVIKPAEQSSLSMIKVAALAAEAGIPDGILNVVPGYGEVAGKALALHPYVRGIFFTGSSEVGKLIIQYSAQSNMKKVGLECGGKSPFIVSSQCKNLKAAADVLAENVFYNQGQICSASSRAIVDEPIFDEFVEYLKGACEKYVPGNPYDDVNHVGCVVSREQYDKVNNYIDIARQEAAEVYQAQTIKDKAENACCIQPTIVLGLSNDARVAREEIFGPVVVVLKAKGLRNAVEIANDTEYGLAGAVFTDDINEAYYAATHIQAGLVHINSYGEDEVHTPFGGIKQSGLGKDRSVWAFDEYSEQKTIWMKFDNRV